METNQGDFDVVVPVDALQYFRQRVREMFATLVSQTPDEFALVIHLSRVLVVLGELVERVSVDHQFQVPEVLRCHLLGVHLITRHHRSMALAPLIRN